MSKMYMRDLTNGQETLIVEAPSRTECWRETWEYLKEKFPSIVSHANEPILSRHWFEDDGSEICDFGSWGYWLKYVER